MELSKRTVNKIPVDTLWTELEELDAERKNYLTRAEISELLNKGPVQFVVANIGDKLLWKDVERCYEIYKELFKDHIINDFNYIDLDHLKDNFGYLASMWEGKFDMPLILLEKIH